ncbi:MAG TPA: hypothetical protein VFA15_06380, partial [Nitrososphaera sp.]|nr:hypothetical protein [Nitrososphaera sp.]
MENMKAGPSIALAFRMTFTRPVYVAIAIAVGVLFWIIFNMFDQLLFFSPMLAFYIPSDAALGFAVSTATAVLLGIV